MEFQGEYRPTFFQDIEKVINEIREDIINLNKYYSDYKQDFKREQIKLRREIVIALEGIMLNYDGEVRELGTMDR